MKFALTVPLCLALVIGGCSTFSAPLADNLQLVPVSDQADKASGLDLTYLSGTNQGALTHVSCDHSKSCWITGILGKFSKDDDRINSLVIHTTGVSHITWANAYQINGIYTASNGLIKTHNGGALLYGNSILRSSYGIRPEPVFEKLDATGHPQWGGAIPAGAIEPWSAFSDAFRTQDGGYLFAGSAHVVTSKNSWYGMLVKVDPKGQIAWAEELNSWNNPTFVNRITQLPDGKILAVGYNATRQDVVLFRLNPNGTLVDSYLLKIQGREIPIGLASTLYGEDVAVAQTMPNGEKAAILLNLDKEGRPKDAARYHYIDGFSPSNIVSLSARDICLFGTTTSPDKSQSIAVELNANRKPVSVLVMKGDMVFKSAARYDTGTVIFAGNRAIGTDQHMTPLLTLWTPALDSNPPVLKRVRRDSLKITVDSQAKAIIDPWKQPQWQSLRAGDLPFRPIYEATKPTNRAR